MTLRFWSNTNPRWMRQLNYMNFEKIMTWVGVIDEQIIGPYFFEGNVTSDAYVEMLTDYLLPTLARMGYDSCEICYMHDGAPAHYTLEVRECLTDNFERWIGRGEGAYIAWPSRSPDLNPLDFFVWGYIKSIIYKTETNNIEELKIKIQEALDSITAEMLSNVKRNLIRRLIACIERNGDLIEHTF